jgi:protein O-mannosyl-transferase
MIRRAMLPLALGILTAVCFLPSVAGSFLNWDDDVNFRHNLAYRGFGWAQVRWAFTSVLFGHYIPFTRLTFSLNYVLGGMDPWGYHLLNVLLHGANAALFYVVVRRLLATAGEAGGRDGRSDFELSVAAAGAALVFAVHPLRVEPVAWITGRADLLCATFLLLSTLMYLRAVEGPGTARRGLIFVCTAGFSAALLSKGAALPFPAALLLLDIYPLGRLRRLGWRHLVSEKIPLLLVTLVATVIIAYATRHGAVITGTADYDAGARFTVAAYSFVISAARLVWPAALSPLYEMPIRVAALEPRFGLAVGAAIVVTAVLIVLRRRWPGGLAAWAFSALMLAPTSVALRKTSDLAPDRYSYLAGLGFAVLVGGAVLSVIRLVKCGTLARPVGWLAAGAGVAVIMGLGATSWGSSEIWREPETLWRWAVELDPACSVCHSKLGESVLGDPAEPPRAVEAERLFRHAITLRPDRPHAYFNLGTALLVQGRYAEAEAPLRSYIERIPKSAAGPERLGRLYLLQSRYEQAIPLLRTALTRQPDMPGLRAYLIEALLSRARELQAIGLGTAAESLLAESRVLGQDLAAPGNLSRTPGARQP